MKNKVFKYVKTGNHYTVLGEVKMKDPTSRNWLDSVMYTNGELTFVREKTEFLERFKEVCEDE